MKLNKKYIPLWKEKYRYAIISGGRGSGKSVGSQAFVRDLSYQVGHKIISTRYTMTSAEKSVIPEFSGKLGWSPSPYGGGDMSKDFSLTGRTFTNVRSESTVSFMGLKTSSGIQTASLKSIEGLTCWLLDEAEELIDDGTDTEPCIFDRLDDSIRKIGIDLRTILVWNPSSEDSFVYKRFFKEPGVDITFNGIKDDVLYIYTTYNDNKEHLHEAFHRKAEKVKAANENRYNHIYLGIPIKENPFALWKLSTMISPYRVDEAPELRRIVVAVDPAVTDTGEQDECGIIAVGQSFRGDFYVLKDISEQLSPRDWGRASAGLYYELKADMIVAEVNQGGALVKDNIRLSGDNLPVEMVHATRGKIVRAEPIAALYEEGRVHHVGHFPELESELCNYTGKNGDKSPNRFDALVWGLIYLSQEEVSVSVGYA